MINKTKIKGEILSYLIESPNEASKYVIKTGLIKYEIDFESLSNHIKNKIRRLADKNVTVEFTAVLGSQKRYIRSITKVKKVKKSKFTYNKFLPFKYFSAG